MNSKWHQDLNQLFPKLITALKVSKYGVFSGRYFPTFGLNTKVYCLNLRIQSEYGKIRTRKNSVFGHFSRSNRRSETFTKIRPCNGVVFKWDPSLLVILNIRIQKMHFYFIEHLWATFLYAFIFKYNAYEVKMNPRL